IQRTGQSVENGWPIPVSMPHCGPTYRLELQNAQRTFTSMTESVLIPEKIHAVQEIGLTMGPLEYLFRPQMELNSQDEACLYLATLQNKRDQALAYVRMVESLNDSILKYVLDYSSTPLPNDILVKCLLGTR
ncbi:MAG: hypothetical protein IKW74_08440, partial [Thermoguttaceae bacterium]|nr:hypothetical protein [Thermoguttaceae bacterium]